MLEKKDPIAMELYRKYNEVAMPNFSLSLRDVKDLMAYMEEETTRLDDALDPIAQAELLVDEEPPPGLLGAGNDVYSVKVSNVGGRATTGRSSRCRSTSAANSFGVP